jgi:hypothetical protein
MHTCIYIYYLKPIFTFLLLTALNQKSQTLQNQSPVPLFFLVSLLMVLYLMLPLIWNYFTYLIWAHIFTTLYHGISKNYSFPCSVCHLCLPCPMGPHLSLKSCISSSLSMKPWSKKTGTGYLHSIHPLIAGFTADKGPNAGKFSRFLPNLGSRSGQASTKQTKTLRQNRGLGTLLPTNSLGGLGFCHSAHTLYHDAMW